MIRSALIVAFAASTTYYVLRSLEVPVLLARLRDTERERDQLLRRQQEQGFQRLLAAIRADQEEARA